MSTSEATKPNADNAFNAMKALGIDRDTVKHVLKNLLRVFDKKWEFIEAENYHVLLDAIFEYEENKKVEVKKKRTRDDSDACEPPKKRVYVCPEEDEASPIGVPSISLSNERINVKKERAKPSSSNTVDKRHQDISRPNLTCSKLLLKEHVKLPSASEKVVSERASSSSCSKLPADESGLVPVDRDPPALNKTSKPSSVGTTRIHTGFQDLVEGSSSVNDFVKSPHCVHVEKTRECDSVCNFQRSECKYDIVSSSSGHVTLCISTLNQATSHAPDIEAVIKSVEEKFLRSHKIVGPPFSFKRLLKELCKSFFKMTADSSARSSEVTSLSKQLAIKNLAISNEKKLDTETPQISQDGMKRQPQLYVDDITKGQENVKISLVGEHGSRKPPKFFYIPKNIIYQKANVNIALARISDEDCCSSCSGDCLSSRVPCACARTTHGEFAYTHNGLLKEEFLKDCISVNRYVYCQDCPIERSKDETKPEKCKGHSVRRFIKECWSKCGCNMQCGNRVVQRGINRQLQVFWTNEAKGWGLRTLENLPKGAFVCEYVGEVVTNTELFERNNQSRVNERHTYPVQLDADWGSESILDDDYALCLDATNYGNVARFVNHRCCDANLLEVPVEVETVDHHYYHLAFFTTREVKALEELSWDYGLDFDDDTHPIKAFRCRCGSPLCRDKTPKGSRLKARAASSVR